MSFKFPSLKEIASFKVASLFWNASFISELSKIKEIHYDSERNWEIRLTNYHEETKCNINTLIRNGYLPTCLGNTLKRDIASLHKAYYQLLSWKITYDPNNKIDLFHHGEHYAPDNFTLDGEFNDLVWTKRFVLDTNCPIIERFCLACSYWFEDESENLWSEIKSSYSASYGHNYDFLQLEILENYKYNSSFIKLKLQEIENESDYYDSFLFLPQFFVANEKGYEHAIYRIWQKMTFFHKYIIIENDGIFEFMCAGIDYPKDKITFFLYSQLSEERKTDLLDWSIEKNRSEVWYTLLITPYAKEIREEIISKFKSLSCQMLSDIFNSIALRIKQHKFRSDKIMFDVLWRSLKRDERYWTLYNGSMFIGTLAKAKSFFNLRSIIRKLSKEAKRKCLLNNKYGAGIDIVRILVSGCDFDFLKEYLCFFLIEYCCIHNNWYHCIHNKRYPCVIYKCIPCTEKITVYKNANNIFEKFVNSSDFKSWYETEISEVERKQVKEVILDIDTSLTLLNLQTSV